MRVAPRHAVALAAAFALGLPASAHAVAGLNSLWVAPDPAFASHWQQVTSIDCFGPGPRGDAVRLTSVQIYNVDIGEGLRLTGQVIDTNGNPIANVPVAIGYGRFRPTDKVGIMTSPKPRSNAKGNLSFRIPASELRRNILIWPLLVQPGATIGTCASKDKSFSMSVITGASDPMVIDVRPLLKVNRTFKTRGRKITIGGRLVADNPKAAGTVQLQQKAGSRWKRLATVRPKPTGVVSFAIQLKKKGRTSFRLVFVPRANATDYLVGAERRFSVAFTPPTPRHRAPVFKVTQGATIRVPEKKTVKHNLPCALLKC